MTWFIFSILLLLCLSLAGNVLLTVVVLRYATMLTAVEENTNKSLDTLDAAYREISHVLEIPLFYDSAEVKTVLASIDRSRTAVLMVAGNIANAVSSEENNQDDEAA